MFASSEKSRTFASLLKNKRHRAFSSAGSEHLPYKQRVGGSNPSTPTDKKSAESRLFLFLYASSSLFALKIFYF